MNYILEYLGYFGIWGTILLESGVPFFFWLPGDSLLMAVGFLSFHDYLDPYKAIGGCFAAAIIGNIIGYEIGRRIGLELFKNGDTRFLKFRHVAMARHFFNKYGHATIILARFVPIVRTFSPFVAGVVRMPYGMFLLYTVVGAIVWVFGLTLVGYFLGDLLISSDLQETLTSLFE